MQKLDFGAWEQIFYGEFDGRRKKRVLVKIIGMTPILVLAVAESYRHASAQALAMAEGPGHQNDLQLVLAWLWIIDGADLCVTIAAVASLYIQQLAISRAPGVSITAL